MQNKAWECSVTLFRPFFFRQISSLEPSRFLVYSPMWGRSHVTFMGKLADVLVEEGHQVVSLPVFFGNV